MTPTEQYTKLTNQCRRLQQKVSEAKGAKAAIMSQIDEQFGCKSLAEAKRLLAKLNKTAEESKAAFENAVQEFYDKHKEVLNCD